MFKMLNSACKDAVGVGVYVPLVLDRLATSICDVPHPFFAVVTRGSLAGSSFGIAGLR